MNVSRSGSNLSKTDSDMREKHLRLNTGGKYWLVAGSEVDLQQRLVQNRERGKRIAAEAKT
jgi:hypothetical protein